ncbi:BRI1 kinase inhibitor 1 [Cajanus cajan]|nr:BRI1 kinase inhibitor 1 [Cajanus cajan]
METHQHQKKTENDVANLIVEVAPQLRQEGNREQEQAPSPQSSTPSSPSQEFSFKISLHHPTFSHNSPPSLALDLSPADDIFFHGHLLPLQLLSHLPESPRSSTNSMDSFTLPIRDFLEDENQNHPIKDSGSTTTSDSNNSSKRDQDNIGRKRVQGKSKFGFSLFGLTKGHKGCQDKEGNEVKHKKKPRFDFDVIHAIKKYLRLVQPRMLFKGQREKIRPHNGQCYSYSGNVTPTNLRGWRGQYSAPASMRTSPTNSGLLIATTPLPPASDSTMEELQAAIQAAIAHCKNSIAKEEKLKC